MPLIEAGYRLAHFEIKGPLGKGGMGEVYRARDTRLGRDVAVKLLPESLSSDEDFRRRFKREAEVLSQLQHPNVCTLFDVGEHDGRDFLVMELLDGETLQQRLERGALTVEELVATGSQISEGIEAAHRRGLVHRDLKPGNVMLTSSGAKVLDFGLAKGATRHAQPVGTQLPTAIPEAMAPLGADEVQTRDGAVVGTLHYMAPEQLEGRADARSDIWALGAILYEMATARRAFEAPSAARLMAAILDSEPESLTTTSRRMPARLRWLIGRCLEKDAERRLQSARDVSIELEAAVATELDAERAPTSRLRSQLLAACGAGLVVGLLIGALTLGKTTERQGSAAASGEDSRHWTTASLRLEPRPDVMALSADGRRLIYGSTQDGLFLRDLRSSLSVAIPETAGTHEAVAFTPDGQEVVYGDDGDQLHQRALTGQFADTELGPGAVGFYSGDGVFYSWTREPGEGLRLWQQRGDGEAELLGSGYAFPGAVAPRNHLFVLRLISETVFASSRMIELLSLDEKARTDIVIGTQAQYLAPGFLIYVSGKEIRAFRLDPDTLLPIGSARSVETGLRFNDVGDGVMALSESGDLVFRRGSTESYPHTIATWVDREGTALGDVAQESGPFRFPRVSLDGRRLSLTSATGPALDQAEEWRLDLRSGLWTRPVHPETYHSGSAEIGPDGAERIFASNRRGEDLLELFVEPTDASAPARLLLPDEPCRNMWLDVSPDGSFVLYFCPGSATAPVMSEVLGGLRLVDRDDGKVERIVSRGLVRSARFHPDGQFIAYADQGADPGVWIKRHDSTATGSEAPAVRLTRGQHREVAWSPSGDELYFRSRTHFMAIPISIVNERIESGRPVELFDDTYETHPTTPGFRNYTVHPDGRLLFFRAADDDDDQVVYIRNWRAKVEALFEIEDSSGIGSTSGL